MSIAAVEMRTEIHGIRDTARQTLALGLGCLVSAAGQICSEANVELAILRPMRILRRCKLVSLVAFGDLCPGDPATSYLRNTMAPHVYPKGSIFSIRNFCWTARFAPSVWLS